MQILQNALFLTLSEKRSLLLLFLIYSFDINCDICYIILLNYFPVDDTFYMECKILCQIVNSPCEFRDKQRFRFIVFVLF